MAELSTFGATALTAADAATRASILALAAVATARTEAILFGEMADVEFPAAS